MTTPDYSALREAAGKATPGPWETQPDRRHPDKVKHVMGPSEIVVGLDGICSPGSLNDRTFAEDAANMAYIALANPATILALLDEREEWLAAVAAPDQGLWRFWNKKASDMMIACEALQATVRSVVAEQDALVDKLQTANALVTCCCGSPVDTHDWNDGHSPVSMYHDRLNTAEAERDALRAEGDALVNTVTTYERENIILAENDRCNREFLAISDERWKAAEAEAAALRQALEDAEEFVIDGITARKSEYEMNAPYPTREPRFKAELEEARTLHAAIRTLLTAKGTAE